MGIQSGTKRPNINIKQYKVGLTKVLLAIVLACLFSVLSCHHQPILFGSVFLIFLLEASFFPALRFGSLGLCFLV